MATRVDIGTLIAGFRVRSALGAGAMGHVYLAEDVATGNQVALKILVPALAEDERFRQRFAREAALAAQLDHPHVVRTLDSGEAEGMLFLAMAFVDGCDLRQLLQREGALEPDRALRLVGGVAAALDAAHAAGLVHRDVKPGNILVAGAPAAEHSYVCDFGLSRHATSASSLTGDRGFVGTIDYVPPEQIAGAVIDGRGDVYSLGCVLFECLAGSRPFERESELSVIFAHLNEPPPRISELRAELPPGFDAVFEKALAKSPEGRYQTCTALVDAASAAARGELPPTRTPRRRQVIAGAAIVAVVAAAAIAGVLAASGGSPRAARQVAIEITQQEIAGAQLGQRADYYKNLFGGYRSQELSEVHYPGLAFQEPETAVYFHQGGKRAIIITTWNPRYRTAAGIGPCSTIAAMKKAYGSAVAGAWSGTGTDGTVHSYVVGNNLLFATNDERTISSVALYHGVPGHTKGGSPQAYANYVAAVETACVAA
jgi:hypothetical protein